MSRRRTKARAIDPRPLQMLLLLLAVALSLVVSRIARADSSCAPAFETSEGGELTEQALTRRLAGYWSEEARSYVKRDADAYDSFGYAFLPARGVFGPVTLRYKNFDVSPTLAGIGGPVYDKISFAKTTLSGPLAGFRLVELRSSQKPSSCESFAFFLWEGRLHVYRGLKSAISSYGTKEFERVVVDTAQHLVLEPAQLPPRLLQKETLSRSQKAADTVVQ